MLSCCLFLPAHFFGVCMFNIALFAPLNTWRFRVLPRCLLVPPCWFYTSQPHAYLFFIYSNYLKFLHRWIYSCLLHSVYLGFIPTTHVYLYNITLDYIVLNVYKQYNMHMRGIVWSQGQLQNFGLVCHMFKIKTTHWHLMHPVKIDFLAGNCCASDMSFLECDILAKKQALRTQIIEKTSLSTHEEVWGYSIY